MPDNLLPAFIVEALIFLSGAILLWHFALRPAARTRARGPSRLQHWDIPVYIYGLTFIRVIAIALVIQILAGQLARRLDPAQPHYDTLHLLLSGLCIHLGMLLGIIVAWFLLRSNRVRAQVDAGLSDSPPPPARLPIAHIPAAGLATFLITMAVTLPFIFVWPWLLEQLGHQPEPQEAMKLFLNAGSPLETAVLIVFATIIAPITEELVFRAGLFRYLRGRLPRFLVFAIPSLLFAFAHISLTAFVPMIVFGVVVAAAYERTGRIAVAMIAHGLFNLHTTIFVLLGYTS